MIHAPVSTSFRQKPGLKELNNASGAIACRFARLAMLCVKRLSQAASHYQMIRKMVTLMRSILPDNVNVGQPEAILALLAGVPASNGTQL